jgi:hypothetical protein
MKLPRPLPLAFALATLFGGSAQAQNLVQMYEAARGYDAGYQSAKAQYEASIAKADQATAGHPAHGEHRPPATPSTQFQQQDGQRNIVIDTSFANRKRVEFRRIPAACTAPPIWPPTSRGANRWISRRPSSTPSSRT